MGFLSSITKPFEDVGKGLGNIAGGAVKVIGSAVKGESLDKGLDRMGGGVTNTLQGVTNLPTFGQADKVLGDKWTKFQSSLEGPGNFIRGKSVGDDFKEYASTVISTGQVALASGGVPTEIGGFDAGGLLNDIMGGLQNKLDGIKMPSYPVNNVPSMQSGSYGGQVAQKNYTPFIVVGAIILVGLVLVIKKKK